MTFKPNGDFPMRYDIAIIKLEKALNFSQFVKQGKLAGKDYAYEYKSEIVTVCGYGEMEESGRQLKCFDAKYIPGKDTKVSYEVARAKFDRKFKAEAFMGLIPINHDAEHIPRTSAGDTGSPVVSKISGNVIAFVVDGSGGLIVPIATYYNFLMGKHFFSGLFKICTGSGKWWQIVKKKWR